MTETLGWITVPVLAPVVAAVVLQGWGERLPRRGDWLAAVSLAVQVAGLSVSWSEHSERGFETVQWIRGWIGPRAEGTSIGMGLLRDTLGLSVSSWVVVLCALLLANVELTRREKRAHRIYAGLGVGSSGVILAWVSGTPWAGFAGVALSILGAFLALGSDWESEQNATYSALVTRERAVGLGIAILGALSVSAGGGVPGWLGSTSAVVAINGVGAFFLAAGLFLQFAAFPVLGSSVMSTHHLPIKRVLISQVFPSLAALALLIRLEPQLRAAGVASALGWAGLASVALSSLTGLVQPQWNASLSSWIAAAFAGAASALAFSGPWAALAIALGAISGATIFALLSSFEHEDNSEARSGPVSLQSWGRWLAIIAALVGTGCLGFVSSGGHLRAILGAIEMDPAGAGTVAGVATSAGQVLFVILGFKLALVLGRGMKPVMVSWVSAASPLAVMVFAMGWLWSGTLSGGVAQGDPDRVMVSLLGSVFGSGKQALQPNDFGLASSLRWGGWILAVFAGVWTCRGESSAWERISRRFPAVCGFLARGYAVEAAIEHLMRGLRWVGGVVQSWVDIKTWQRGIPGALGWSSRGIANFAAKFDSVILARIDRGARSAVEAPSRVLKWIQGGDAQWYLFFAVGSVIAVLIHFLIRGGA